MKTVVFICLLAVSLVLSKPSDPTVKPDHPAEQQQLHPGVANDPKANDSKTIVPADKAKTESTPAPADPNSKPAKDNEANQTKGKPSAEVTAQPPVDNKSEKKEEPQKDDPKKQDSAQPVPPTKETKPEEKKVEPNNNVPPTPAPTNVVPAKNDVKPDGKKEEKPANETKASSPPTPTKADEVHVVQARGFDGASFVGGIILTLGMLAIGFMGFKYYKNQTERNYHTL